MRKLTALLESIFVSPKAAAKSDLGNHSKFPLYLVTNWFKNLWKVPWDLMPYVSRTEKDLTRFVHWRCHWVPWWQPLSRSLTLMYHTHAAPFAVSGHGVCRQTVPTQIIFYLRWLAIKCVFTCKIMSFSLHVDAYQVTWGLKRLGHRAEKHRLWLNFAVSSFPLFFLSHPS